MNWFIAILMVGLAGWAVWRGYEAYSLNKLIVGMIGDLNNQKVRSFVDRLAPRPVPNSPTIWRRLREVESRVMRAGTVSPRLKEELRVTLEAKGDGF